MSEQPGNGELVLVTGGSGFLGGWCIVELLRQGFRVRTTVRDLAREAQVRESLAREIEPDGRLTFAQADLTSDAGWDDAVDGCKYVLHVASPFPPTQPKDADELIVPAREGTLRVLRAALAAGVERVVVTSSIAAVDWAGPGKPDRPLNEDDWTDPNSSSITPYTKSKTVAERAAWALVDESHNRDRMVTVNPGAIIGPVLSEDSSFSIQLIERLLKGEPAVPQLGFNLVDVRDVAKLEVLAMTTPAAGGQRLIAVKQFAWMAEIAEVLRDRMGDAAGKVPTRVAPNFMIKMLAIFDKGLKTVAGSLGVKTEYSSARAKQLLDWEPRPIEESIVDCAQSLIDLGVVNDAA